MEAKEIYIEYYGKHFSKKAYEYAVKQMKSRDGQELKPITKQQAEDLMKKHGIELKKGKGYDAAYLLMMARADYYGSSIEDEKHLCLFVKDYLEDPDGTDEMAFERWMATEEPDFDELI